MDDLATPTSQPPALVPELRASLHAKLERLLARPLIARVGAERAPEGEGAPPGDVSMFQTLRAAARSLAPERDAWVEDAKTGTVTVRVSIDYERSWREREREVLETVKNAVEGSVALLTEAQKRLLETAPRDFLGLVTRPETVELVDYEQRNIGGQLHVVALTLGSLPASRADARYVAVIPNLIAIERQLAALTSIENAPDDGPLAPLRALVGLGDASSLPKERAERVDPPATEGLDASQRDCIEKAVATPHFALIEGPPGSGKTKVISEIVRHALSTGERVLVVSPTHVAVDNVVERLTRDAGTKDDRLHPASVPVRYSARTKKLSPKATEYWVGPKRQLRGAAIARRVEARLTANVPIARRLFELVNENAAGQAPISSAMARLERVICGTPIGILSFEPVKSAAPAAYDLLIVDEVSKMTLGEFLAVAVKARRWVLVGDPMQLPPFNDAEENGDTLGDLIPPVVELACSVAAVLERARPERRRELRIVVASSEPERAAAVVRAQLRDVFSDRHEVAAIEPGPSTRVLVTRPDDVARAVDALTSLRVRAVGVQPTPEVIIIAERGIAPPEQRRPHELYLDPRARAQAAIFETASNVYVTQPWAAKTSQRLGCMRARYGLAKYLPSDGALAAYAAGAVTERACGGRDELVQAIALRFAVNAVSVFDWLTALPRPGFDVSPLRDLDEVGHPWLVDAVSPYVAKLTHQYRMHPSISRTPRELFYFEKALFDGKESASDECCVELVQVDARGPELESNEAEVEQIAKILRHASAIRPRSGHGEIMIITPYRAQEDRLRRALESLDARGEIANLSVDLCTFDRCQGREAETVIISLVRSRASTFLDVPNRWNVALTRAKNGLFIVGNIAAYLNEAARARAELRPDGGNGCRGPRAGETRPQMSVLARIIEAYDSQLRASARKRA